MKYFIIKMGNIFLIALLVVLIVFITVAGYQCLTVAVAPRYNPETMPLNFEILGLGKITSFLSMGIKTQPLLAESNGELDYALDFFHSQKDILTIE